MDVVVIRRELWFSEFWPETATPGVYECGMSKSVCLGEPHAARRKKFKLAFRSSSATAATATAMSRSKISDQILLQRCLFLSCLKKSAVRLLLRHSFPFLLHIGKRQQPPPPPPPRISLCLTMTKSIVPLWRQRASHDQLHWWARGRGTMLVVGYQKGLPTFNFMPNWIICASHNGMNTVYLYYVRLCRVRWEQCLRWPPCLAKMPIVRAAAAQVLCTRETNNGYWLE